jgi:hypothetical protein
MPLADFQRALCDMIADPELCLAVRARPAAALQPYSLTPLEQRRLETVSRQPGMSTNCTLYRVNRAAPLYSMLGLSCSLLGERFLGVALAFWARERETGLQHLEEARLFAGFLRQKLEDGSLADPYLGEVLDFEEALNDLKLVSPTTLAAHRGAEWLWDGEAAATHCPPHVRVVRFHHEPLALLASLASSKGPPHVLEEGLFHLALMAVEGGEVALRRLEPCRGAA